MTFNDYQDQAHETSLNTRIGNDTILYPALGLANEAGEVLGKLKKIYRDSNGEYKGADRIMIAKELGDVLWYVAELTTKLNFDLNEVAQGNLIKLAQRKAQGTIKGDGDER